MDFCGKSNGFGFWKHSGLWISYEFWSGFRIVSVLMFESWVENEIWIIDLSSALVGMFMSSSKLFFLEPNSFKLRCETVGGIVLCTFELLHFCFRMSGCVCGFEFEQNYGRFNGFGEKRHWSADLHNPIHPPPLGKPLTGNMFSMENKIKIWSAKILPSQSVPTVTRKLQALEKTHPVTGPLCALKNKTNRNICCQSISLI